MRNEDSDPVKDMEIGVNMPALKRRIFGIETPYEAGKIDQYNGDDFLAGDTNSIKLAKEYFPDELRQYSEGYYHSQ